MTRSEEIKSASDRAADRICGMFGTMDHYHGELSDIVAQAIDAALSAPPVPTQSEEDAIANWLRAYANNPKWKNAGDGEVGHFADHAADYIGNGWWRDPAKYTFPGEKPVSPLQATEYAMPGSDSIVITRSGHGQIGLPERLARVEVVK